MSDATVRLEHRPDGVAVLTFDQPGSKANVLTAQMWSDLEAALDSLAGRTDVRGLVLASAKPGIFIAGADLKLLGSAGPNDPAVRTFIEQGLRTLAKLEALPFPTCAAIAGAALGGGLEVTLACDFRVCDVGENVQLALPETKLGLIPGWGGTQRLSRIIGMKAAAAALTTGKDVRDAMSDDADLVDTEAGGEALMRCAVSHVIDGREESARRRQVKQSPVPQAERAEFRETMPSQPAAAREAIAVLVKGAALPLTDAIALETEAFLRLAGSDESRRLIAEFFASRKK